MVATPNSSYISPEDYLKGEETSPNTVRIRFFDDTPLIAKTR
ncbi:hypothetical protein [Nostoc mirabile]|nr:hypothetical protein [Nostoc mirabile]